MIKLLKSFTFTLLSVLIGSIFYTCANIGTITGGDRDSIAPVMVGSKPGFADTGFKENAVFIYFDEFFSLKDINQEFYSSPPFKEIPDFKIKKRGLRVKFNEPLKDSVTYTLNFGNGIVDFNESNVLKNLRFVFSTKSNVDSFSIGGNLRKAFDQTAPEKSMVMLFENNEDSIPFKSLPSYLCKTDSSGDFSIDFIRPGSYKIFALNDKNGNQLADFFEERAFLDSLILPERQIRISVDSLKAGTVLHDTINNITDSLLNDTAIVSRKYVTSPANLCLYLFTEDNQAQKILDYSRKERGNVSMFFALPVTKDFEIKPINFEISPDSVLVERSQNNDTINWWIRDLSVRSIDSLQVGVSFISKDSIGNPFLKTDTLILEYRQKKDDDAWKRKPKEEKVIKREYLMLNYIAKDKKVDLNRPLRIESPVPLKNVDTSAIKLFEIIDTSVVDTKEQAILKAFRLKRDQLSFRFKRPLAEEFNLYPINFKAEQWYTSLASDSNRIYTCDITNNAVAMMDTLKMAVEFDNHFFLGQIQVLSDTAIMPITSHKILSRKRTEPDKITLVFDKPLVSSLTITPSDFNAAPSWYGINNITGKDTIVISITDKNVILKDTLTFQVKCFDYIGLNDDSVYFSETMRLTYKEKDQFLVSASRIKNDQMKLVFNKRITENPVLEPLNFTINTKWFEMTKNNTGDTLSYKITDEMVLAMDSMHFLLKFKDTNRKGKTNDFADTVLLTGNMRSIPFGKKTEELKTEKQKTGPQTVHIYVPTDFKVEEDTLNIRQRLITKKWKEDSKYLLRLDSLVFTSIFDLYNLAEDYEFSTPSIDFYSTLLLRLKNTKPSVLPSVTDSLEMDTLINVDGTELKTTIKQKDIDDLIGQGNLIVQLLGDKDVLVKEFLITKDQDIKIEFLNPGKYKIKIIFDRNANDKWDTGNYFKHIQPERVVNNGETLNLKSGTVFELEWNVGESLINSFTKQEKQQTNEMDMIQTE